MLAIAKFPTPILNVADFKAIFGGRDGASLPKDSQGLVRQIEMIALSGTVFEIQEKCTDLIYRIRLSDYKSDQLFVDQRFLDIYKELPCTPKCAPPHRIILQRLSSLIGLPYIWGGNWSQGIPQMLKFYPPQKKIDETTRSLWSFKGVDCSGLLYEVTDGFTPRNTSELIFFGRSLPVLGKSASEIQKILKPLDMIVWKGHIVLVLDEQTAIESRAGFGVIKTPLLSRLLEIMQERKPANAWDASNPFVIQRWHPEL